MRESIVRPEAIIEEMQKSSIIGVSLSIHVTTASSGALRQDAGGSFAPWMTPRLDLPESSGIARCRHTHCRHNEQAGGNALGNRNARAKSRFVVFAVARLP